MMTDYTIEKNIPLPVLKGAGRGLKYPFALLEKGDSFFIKDATVKTISRSCGTYGKRLSRKFASRTVDGGVRVWRVE